MTLFRGFLICCCLRSKGSTWTCSCTFLLLRSFFIPGFLSVDLLRLHLQPNRQHVPFELASAISVIFVDLPKQQRRRPQLVAIETSSIHTHPRHPSILSTVHATTSPGVLPPSSIRPRASSPTISSFISIRTRKTWSVLHQRPFGFFHPSHSSFDRLECIVVGSGVFFTTVCLAPIHDSK